MPIAAGLFLTTFLASGPQPAVPPASPVAAVQEPQPQDDPRTTPASSSTTKPHEVGLGGFGGSGGGPSFRYFFGEQVGVDLSAGWYRPMTSGSSSRGTSFQVSPSMVVMLNKSHQLADLDVRPFVGGGVIYMNTPTTIARTTSTTQLRQSGVGMQAFGGVELTFASAPSIAISAETIYHKLPIQTYNVNLTRGLDFYLLFHYYMK
jgi:hypothetical protein